MVATRRGWLLLATLVTLLLGSAQASGAKRGNANCKHCSNKNQLEHHNRRLIASPINLLNPDRYEFYTLDDRGKVVKRIMTFKEVQSIVAGSDISEQLKLFANSNNNDRIMSSVVTNVRNVLNNELNLMHQNQDSVAAAELPISEMILDVQDDPMSSSSSSSSAEYGPERSTEVDTSEETSSEATIVTVRTPTSTRRPTESTTKRVTTQVGTKRPAESMEQLKTVDRPKIRPTIGLSVGTTFRPVEGSTVPTTTTTTTTMRPTERSTTEVPKVRSTTASTTLKTTESTTMRSTTRPTTSTTVRSTEKPTQRSTTRPSVRPSSTELYTTTTGRPTENPSFKLAERTTTTARPMEPPTVKQPVGFTSTEKPTMLKLAETSPKTPGKPPGNSVELSTEQSSEQSVDYSTLRSEELPQTSAGSSSGMEDWTEVEESGSSEKVPVVAEKEQVGLKTDVSASETSTRHSSTKPVTTTVATSVPTQAPTSVSSTTTTTTTATTTTTTTTTTTAAPPSPPPVKIVSTSSTTTKTTKKPAAIKPSEAFEALKDLAAMVAGTAPVSEEESSTVPVAFSTFHGDPVAAYVGTLAQKVAASSGGDETTVPSKLQTTFVDLPELTTTEANVGADGTTTSVALERDDSETLEHSTGFGSEEQSSTTYAHMDSDTSATVPVGEYITYKPAVMETTLMDSSTIPTDAQHAIHKIIESLQSIGDKEESSAMSDEEESSDEESFDEAASFSMDIPGLSYDTDAQSSINAIIQSLGQVSGEMPSTTTDGFVTTTELEADTVRAVAKTTSTTSTTSTTTSTTTTTTTPAPTTTTTTASSTLASTTTTTPSRTRTTTPRAAPLRTSSSSVTVPTTTTTVASSQKTTTTPAIAQAGQDTSSAGLNFNANIVETIEKFLSKYASLPSDETAYAMNLTNTGFNLLPDYPAELNMTEYVDRTATVASVLKFPQTKPLDRMDTLDGSIEQREDPVAIGEEDTLVTQSLLNETVASFMKLGEMLTNMGGGAPIRSVVESPSEVAPLELKTIADDEEETELRRFLAICGNLGTTTYGFLTDGPSFEGRSLVYSPFATITTLSMLFLGTRGTTAERINGVIGLDEMTSFNPHLFFKSIADDVNRPKQRRSDGGAGPYGQEQEESYFSRTLLSDVSRGGGLQRFFKARIQEIYGADAETVDFRQKDALLRHMSGDFPREYVDTLKQLRSPLVSISRNRYRHDCNSATTTYGTMSFRPSSMGTSTSGTVTMPSVSLRSGFSTGFSSVLDATILALPGASSNVSVFFLKPSTPGKLAALEEHMRTQAVSAALKLFPDETVRTAYGEVQLPHFTQTTLYNMSESIRQQLGLENLFDPNGANFNGLQDSGAVSNLYLAETIQTDSFTLCGDGAAGRALPFRTFSTNLVKQQLGSSSRSSPAPGKTSAGRNRRKHHHQLSKVRNRSGVRVARSVQDSTLQFDTPFLYMVRHNPTGLFLYVGRFLGNKMDK